MISWTSSKQLMQRYLDQLSDEMQNMGSEDKVNERHDVCIK